MPFSTESSDDSLLDLEMEVDFREVLIEGSNTNLGFVLSPAESGAELQRSFASKIEENPMTDGSRACQAIDFIFASMIRSIGSDGSGDDWQEEHEAQRLPPGMLSPPKLTPLRSVCPDQRAFLRRKSLESSL